jgi:protein involved in polysaccharide export with SLBB domain
MRRATGGMVLMTSLYAASCAGGPVSSHQPIGPQNLETSYRLGPGDRIRVITYGEPRLTGEFSVDGSGAVSMPLIGDVRASGATAPQLKATLESVLRGDYINNPNVTVEVLTYRPFFILGEVQVPGRLPYSNGLTVMNAVAAARGFTLRANTKKVFIRRNGEPAEKAYPLTPSIKVGPGDTIRIPARFF